MLRVCWCSCRFRLSDCGDRVVCCWWCLVSFLCVICCNCCLICFGVIVRKLSVGWRWLSSSRSCVIVICLGWSWRIGLVVCVVMFLGVWCVCNCLVVSFMRGVVLSGIVWYVIGCSILFCNVLVSW